MGDSGKDNNNVPIHLKYLLTISEASAYFGIGENSLREWVRDNYKSEYVFFIGKKILIKRKLFESFLDNNSCLI